MANEDPKNPAAEGGLSPATEAAIASAVARATAGYEKKIVELERKNEEAYALANRKGDESIAPVKVELKEEDVRRVIFAIPSSTAWYYVKPKPWKSARQLGHFTPHVLAARVEHFENGKPKDDYKGLSARFRAPSHQIGCDMLDFTVLHFDIATHPLNVEVTQEQIDASNKARARFAKTGALPDDALILPLEAVARAGHGFYPLQEAMDAFEKLNERIGLAVAEPGFPVLQRESVFFSWAVKHYVARWAGLRIDKLARQSAKDPSQFDVKSGLGLLEALDEMAVA